MITKETQKHGYLQKSCFPSLILYRLVVTTYATLFYVSTALPRAVLFLRTKKHFLMYVSFNNICDLSAARFWK